MGIISTVLAVVYVYRSMSISNTTDKHKKRQAHHKNPTVESPTGPEGGQEEMTGRPNPGTALCIAQNTFNPCTITKQPSSATLSPVTMFLLHSRKLKQPSNLQAAHFGTAPVLAKQTGSSLTATNKQTAILRHGEYMNCTESTRHHWQHVCKQRLTWHKHSPAPSKQAKTSQKVQNPRYRVCIFDTTTFLYLCTSGQPQ
jgi:hypothetical protein